LFNSYRQGLETYKIIKEYYCYKKFITRFIRESAHPLAATIFYSMKKIVRKKAEMAGEKLEKVYFAVEKVFHEKELATLLLMQSKLSLIYIKKQLNLLFLINNFLQLLTITTHLHLYFIVSSSVEINIFMNKFLYYCYRSSAADSAVAYKRHSSR
jgi:hypothetical protein